MINYKDWDYYCNIMKENGIKTFGELFMYCKAWKVKSGAEMKLRLLADHTAILNEELKQTIRG